MMKDFMVCLIAAVGVVALAEPSVSVTAVSQDPVTRLLRVDYTLSNESAIVTMSAKTNNVAVQTMPARSIVNSLDPTCIDGQMLQPGEHVAFWRVQEDAEAGGFAVAAGELTVEVKAWAPTNPPPYMLVDLTSPSNVHYYASAEDLPFGPLVTNDSYRTDYMLFRKIPARGTCWRMGSPEDEDGRSAAYGGHETCHYVNMTNDYYMAVFELTQGQCINVAGSIPVNDNSTLFTNFSDSACRPVNGISQEYLRGALDQGACFSTNGSFVTKGSFIGKLRTLTGIAFDLPTEAQWEFACRAGTGTPYNDGSTSISDVGWDKSNAGSTTHPVGMKAPNAFGLYDMHGNVMEWTLDIFVATMSAAEVTEPTGGAFSASANYVRKGGCYNYASAASRSAAVRPFGYSSVPEAGNGCRLVCRISVE